MSETLAQRRRALLERFAESGSAEQRLQMLISDARNAEVLDRAERREALLVPGCVAQVWFRPSYRDGRCHFVVDSDSLVSKGLGLVLCRFYDGVAPVEILAHPPRFFADAGLSAALTANRRSAISRMWGMIRDFATACSREGS